jgi:hypothetical protein
MLSNDFVTDTRAFLQFVPLEQLDLPPMRLDDPGVLKRGRYLREGRSSDPKHPAQELMSERDDVGAGLVTRLQKPTAKGTTWLFQQVSLLGSNFAEMLT